jgi:hypothetical protein
MHSSRRALISKNKSTDLDFTRLRIDTKPIRIKNPASSKNRAGFRFVASGAANYYPIQTLTGVTLLANNLIAYRSPELKIYQDIAVHVSHGRAEQVDQNNYNDDH